MTRYIDADALLQKLPNDLSYKSSVKRVLLQAPTADVVPRAEVTEIFEEIERTARAVIILLKFERNENIKNIKTECYTDLISYIAEVKKKYTEDKHNEKRRDY